MNSGNNILALSSLGAPLKPRALARGAATKGCAEAFSSPAGRPARLWRTAGGGAPLPLYTLDHMFYNSHARGAGP